MNQALFSRSLSLAVLLAAGGVHAAELSLQEQVDVLKARVQELDAKVRPLQRAETTAGDKGFILASADGATSLRVRGLIQFDSRWFFDRHVDNDALVLRRGRIGLEGKVGKTTDYQVTGEFAGSTASLLDANLTLNYSPALALKFGRFKTPVGLEQLQSDTAMPFAERSVVSQLLPNRDIGVQVGGELADGRVAYALGVFNGTVDGSNNTSQTDANDGKDLAGRLIFQPWAADKDAFLSGLSFGVGGTYGLQDASGALTSGYKTDGQQTFFAYRTTGAGTSTTSVVANGRVSRLTPQLAFYRGSFGSQLEFVTSTADILATNKAGAVISTQSATIRNHAWQLQASYVLTGEEASYKGVTPSADFDRASGSWGAFELVGRVASIRLDDRNFAPNVAQFANPAKSAAGADTLGIGLNWYLSKLARLTVDYERTRFIQAAGAASPPVASPISHPETLLVTRFSLNF